MSVNKGLTFNHLTHQQQSALTAALLLHDLVRLPSITFDLLDGSFRADLFDPSVLDIRFHAPDGLQIGRTTMEMMYGRKQERFVGGAALIPELTSKPTPTDKP